MLDDIPFTSELNALVVVAHPDDETLWSGGLMLMFPSWRWRVISLCRGSDPDRRPRFFEALKAYDAQGDIGNLDDGPDQHPLNSETVASAVKGALFDNGFDLVVTHSPFGEYTRHRRHEETARAVLDLWARRVLRTRELWFFAYSDDDRVHLPRAIEAAPVAISLPDEIWRKKSRLVGEVYGFAPDSWEYRTTPKQEAFWRFRTVDATLDWVKKQQGTLGFEDDSRVI